jgi:hypothetical protein
MNPILQTKDLVVLTADKNTQFAVRGILSRYRSLGIRKLESDFYVHPEKDPGVFHNAHDYLRVSLKSHAHALVFMDRIGSGQEAMSREELEQHLEDALTVSGWNDRGAVVVLDPELEIWVWSDSPHVDQELGWSGQPQDLRSWLRKQGFLEEKMLKPDRPKEAMEAVLRTAHRPRSSAIYKALAEKVSLAKCTDSAFLKLKDVLKRWFSQD